MPSAEGDAIDGVDGTDTIDGGGGGDTISFSGAGSVARGGDGTDDITFHLPASSSPIMGTAYGDGGDDGVAFDVSYSQDQVTYSGNISLHGGEGSDTISGRGGIYSTPFQNTDVYLYGDGGNDRLEATAQNTFSNYMPYEGGGNDDFLYGGAGNDTYFVQEKQDVAIEKPGEGYDTVEVTIPRPAATRWPRTSRSSSSGTRIIILRRRYLETPRRMKSLAPTEAIPWTAPAATTPSMESRSAKPTWVTTTTTPSAAGTATISSMVQVA